MGVNPGMIEDGLTESDFVALVISDLLDSGNEGMAGIPLLEEDEETVKNDIVRLMGHVNDKITTCKAINYLR